MKKSISRRIFTWENSDSALMSTRALTGLCHCWGEGGGFRLSKSVFQVFLNYCMYFACQPQPRSNSAWGHAREARGTALRTTKHSRTLSDSEQDVGLIFYLIFLLKNASSKSARSDVSFGVRSRHTIGLAPFYLRLQFPLFGTMSWVLFRENSHSVWPATPPPPTTLTEFVQVSFPTKNTDLYQFTVRTYLNWSKQYFQLLFNDLHLGSCHLWARTTHVWLSCMYVQHARAAYGREPGRAGYRTSDRFSARDSLGPRRPAHSTAATRQTDSRSRPSWSQITPRRVTLVLVIGISTN